MMFLPLHTTKTTKLLANKVVSALALLSFNYAFVLLLYIIGNGHCVTYFFSKNERNIPFALARKLDIFSMFS